MSCVDLFDHSVTEGESPAVCRRRIGLIDESSAATREDDQVPQHKAEDYEDEKRYHANDDSANQLHKAVVAQRRECVNGNILSALAVRFLETTGRH